MFNLMTKTKNVSRHHYCGQWCPCNYSDEVIKSPFHKNNEGTSKKKKKSYRNDLIIRVCQKDTMVPMLYSYLNDHLQSCL